MVIPQLRHPRLVSLQSLQRRLGRHLQHPLGRLAGLLLLAAMAVTALPPPLVHAHGGDEHDHGHAHAAQFDETGQASADDGQTATSTPQDAWLHAHDTGACVAFLPAIADGIASGPVPTMSLTAPVVPSPPLAARTPPHRPPIA